MKHTKGPVGAETRSRGSQTKPVVTKHTGLRHLFAATSYSWAGFRRLLQEAAFRHELLMCGAAAGLFAVLGASIDEFITGGILFLALFAIEALNTAVEEVIDRISPEISSVGKHAKDLGSFAVFCMLCACGLYMLVVAIRHAPLLV
ncbi:diacylglycerol kinase [Oryzifoliimicrobium ureilyticus]|uniref:diacylglycerol kinase n=1 Tax=Oryzifoliimicrobium ureilyticus TaxID=3113724 RepID=UPI00307652E0